MRDYVKVVEVLSQIVIVIVQNGPSTTEPVSAAVSKLGIVVALRCQRVNGSRNKAAVGSGAGA